MSSLSAAIRTAQSESRRRQEFFLLQKVRPGSWAHPASFSMDTGVKHSGREVYHSSPPSVEVMNEWSCISTSPVCLHGVDRNFFLIVHMRATWRAHHVVMRLLCNVKLPSFKFLPAATSRPGPHIQQPHRSALLPPPYTSPTHHASCVYRDNNGVGHFLSSTLGKFHCPVTCSLVSPPW